MVETILDFGKQDREYYKAKTKPEIVEIDKCRYLTIDGQGKPEEAPFQEAINAIYSEIYSLKFHYRDKGKQFKVPKLECLWWVDEEREFSEAEPEEWRWKLLLRIPEYFTMGQVKKSASELKEKGKLQKVFDFQLEYIEEGICAQLKHIGPYEDVSEAYLKLEDYMNDLGIARNGPYHEIYISDPTKTEPSKLRTIIRVPVR